MALILEGQGTTYTRAGIVLKPTKITVPGWSKEEIDNTTLSNTEVKTALVATLKKTGNIVLTLEFDPSVYASVPEGNLETTITFGGTTEKITYWADIQELGNVDMETDTKPTFDVTLITTNMNATGVETKPAYAAS